MSPDDAYLEAAWRRAEEIQHLVPEFRLVNRQKYQQGKNNRIVYGFFSGEPAVLKYYADEFRDNSTKARRRRGKELFFLRHAAYTDVVPRVFCAAFEDLLILEEVPGTTLQALHDRKSNSLNWSLRLTRLCHSLGSVHAKLATLALDEEGLRLFQHEYCDERNIEVIVEHVLSLGQRICEQAGGFGEAELEGIAFVRSKLADALKEPRILYKYDLNLSNIIVLSDEVTALIDFEQCYIGTESMYIGAVYDAMHRLPWPPSPGNVECRPALDWEALSTGYHAQAPQSSALDDMDMVLAMAIYNNWVRTTGEGRWKDGSDLGVWGQRFLARFKTYQAMLN